MSKDLKLQPEPVCPHCGHEERDAWEIRFSDDTATKACNSCGEDYIVSRDVTVYYSTRKP